jgi:hypothetical protein
MVEEINFSVVMVISDLSGLGLHGTLGYLLSDLRSLRKL